MSNSTAALTALYRAHRTAKDFGYRQTFEAADLGVSANTLATLVRDGLVVRKENVSSLRGGNRFGYRLTPAGRAAALTR